VTSPARLQLSRRAGFDLQAQSRALNGLPARSVARPGPYGNPWMVRCIDGHWCVDDPDWFVRHWSTTKPNRRLGHENRGWCSSRRVAQRYAVWCFRVWARNQFVLTRWTPLRGQNLACWCADGDPCHAPVLIHLSNKETENGE
jgi:hypothetical protein